MEVLGEHAKTEEIVEGMEHDHTEECDHHEEEIFYDEHIWLSLKNASVFVESLEQAHDQHKLDIAHSNSALDQKYANHKEHHNQQTSIQIIFD